jgi:hypothetical protein
MTRHCAAAALSLYRLRQKRAGYFFLSAFAARMLSSADEFISFTAATIFY